MLFDILFYYSKRDDVTERKARECLLCIEFRSETTDSKALNCHTSVIHRPVPPVNDWPGDLPLTQRDQGFQPAARALRLICNISQIKVATYWTRVHTLNFTEFSSQYFFRIKIKSWFKMFGR